MVRRMDARQRMGPKLTNCCRPEQMGTQGYAKNVAENSSTGRWQGPSKGGKKLEE